ncbi:MAG: pilus assembly protein PilP [Desulfobulbaceae bacterium]|nr:pilus assembly protein PilP [Desulfobulbaceae bacterium]
MKDNKKIVIGTLLFVCVSMAMLIETPRAEDTMGSSSILEKLSRNDYEYQWEGRADPFLPFISSKPTKKVDDEILDTERPKSGLTGLEPGQLTVVAILMTSREKLAMVQDVTGVGYVLRAGMEIGARGTVSEIFNDKVIVEEVFKTRLGNESTRDITMRLNKEGDK